MSPPAPRESTSGVGLDSEKAAPLGQVGSASAFGVQEVWNLVNFWFQVWPDQADV